MGTRIKRIFANFFVLAFANGNLKEKWSQFIKNKNYLAVTGIFFVIAYSGFYSELTPYYWDRVRVALPFLVLPFAFLNVGLYEIGDVAYKAKE